MQVKRVKAHKYLGMALDYSTVGQVKITMLDYIDGIFGSFDKSDPTGGGAKSSTAPAVIFNVDEGCKKLSTKLAMYFHCLVAKILSSTKWDRPDTCIKISFLTMRGREPDNDDWSNFVYLMKCIISTRNLPLILSTNVSNILKWWICGSFVVNPNIRGHTGGGLSIGRGFPIDS